MPVAEAAEAAAAAAEEDPLPESAGDMELPAFSLARALAGEAELAVVLERLLFLRVGIFLCDVLRESMWKSLMRRGQEFNQN